ncbi:carboxypeptidase-like regulatory domain-containing protein [Mangrovibacterium diazotrophicum]|uniref:Carboxypeptidase-like protein n=1 Tax=Mangrovibacterium diazotrophicum TaxID=1261403 RepID=A0A419W7K4_9BACT|nr:carboxypeptidase-like regulatory domain-containing protein [Mangrovibacterium diazotrophicum]RKD91425.1 carboxypeptidase-like protein [Mangrovibacterium diazotrophicum]
MRTALILLSLLILSGSYSTAGESKTRNITGQIVDTETRQPLPDVSVTLDNGSFVLGTLTNSNGQFTLWKIPNSCKNLVISVDGYQSTTVSIEHIKDLKREDGTLLISLQGERQAAKQISLNEKDNEIKKD